MFAFQAVHNTKPKAPEQNKKKSKPTKKNPHSEKLSKENSKNKIFNLRVDTSHAI